MPRKKKKKRANKKKTTISYKGAHVCLGGLDEFISRFERIAEIAGCKEACKLLSKRSKTWLYLMRIHLTKPRVDKGEPIDKKQAKILAIIFRVLREKCDIELIEGKEKISIGDIYVIECFMDFLDLQKQEIPLEKLTTEFKPLIDAYQKLKPSDELLYEMYDNILAMLNVTGKDMFSIKASFEAKKHPITGVFHIVRVKHHRPVKRSITIEGRRRPIVQFGWPVANGGIWYLTIKSEDIKEIYKGPKKELDVYIQSHAIKRFEERTKPLSLLFCRIFMAKLLRYYNVIEVYHNKIYLPQFYGDVKIGYFVADIIDEKIIIKSFLFITNYSTPEGQKLAKLSGLGKKDMSYWHFDSLTSFLATPPEEGSMLKEIMNQAGIDQLFKLKHMISSDSEINDVDWAEVEAYIEEGREERLRIPEDRYEEEYC